MTDWILPGGVHTGLAPMGLAEHTQRAIDQTDAYATREAASAASMGGLASPRVVVKAINDELHSQGFSHVSVQLANIPKSDLIDLVRPVDEQLDVEDPALSKTLCQVIRSFCARSARKIRASDRRILTFPRILGDSWKSWISVLNLGISRWDPSTPRQRHDFLEK